MTKSETYEQEFTMGQMSLKCYMVCKENVINMLWGKNLIYRAVIKMAKKRNHSIVGYTIKCLRNVITKRGFV